MSPAAPMLGPLAAAVVEPAAWAGRTGVDLLYADLDLAERADLRRALGAPTEAADTELVLAAYRRWGLRAAEHLGGAFAFAVWDGERQAVVAMRDAAGLRPLFWSSLPGRVVVGGDLRAVLAAGVPDDLDEDILAAVLLFGQFQPASVGRTHFRAVDDLRGGLRVVIGERGVHLERWWRPEDAAPLPLHGIDEIGEALRAILREVVAEAVADEAPGTVGVHLSAGLDSSTVAALAAEALPEPPVAYSWQPPPEPGAAEHARIQAVAERWALPVEWCPPQADDSTAAYALDPARDPTTMWAPEAPVRRRAAERGTRLLLSGWGGDEAASYSGRGLISAHLLRSGRWGAVAATIARDPVDALRRARGWRRRWTRTTRQPSLAALRDAALRGEHGTFARPDLLRRATLPVPDLAPSAPHAHIVWLLRRGHIGERTGAWARAGAPAGLRYRYPLLDRRVLSFVHGLPVEAFLTRGRLRRWPLRAAGEGLVPDAVRLYPSKREPRWVAQIRRAHAEAARRLLPIDTVDRAGAYAAHIDTEALARALDAWLTEAASERETKTPVRGLHALAYLAPALRGPCP